jgi:hypothetical protein
MKLSRDAGHRARATFANTDEVGAPKDDRPGRLTPIAEDVGGGPQCLWGLLCALWRALCDRCLLWWALPLACRFAPLAPGAPLPPAVPLVPVVPPLPLVCAGGHGSGFGTGSGVLVTQTGAETVGGAGAAARVASAVEVSAPSGAATRASAARFALESVMLIVSLPSMANPRWSAQSPLFPGGSRL